MVYLQKFIVISLCIFSFSQLNAEVTHVHIMSGQSNMMGHGKFSDGSYKPQSIDAKIGYYYDINFHFVNQSSKTIINSGSWKTLDVYNNSSGSMQYESPHFGSEISFGRQIYQKLGNNHVILKVGQGGTSLAVDWNSRSTDGTNLTWLRWVKQVTLALNELVAKETLNGNTVNIASISWIQGESDVQSYSAKYETNFTHLVAGMFSHLQKLGFDTSETRFMNGSFSTNNIVSTDTVKLAKALVVQTAQKKVMASLKHGYYIDNSDLTDYLDTKGGVDNNIHWAGPSHFIIGERFASTYIASLSVEP